MPEVHNISIPEKFDFAHHKSFTEQANKVLEDKQTKTLVLDFSRTAYLDSSALGMLVLINKKAKAASIKTIIRGARDNAREILIIANFDQLFVIE